MLYTSSEANKLLKQTQEELENLNAYEDRASVFHAALGENVDDVRPEFDIVLYNQKVMNLHKRIREIKHAISKFNLTTELPSFPGLTVDQALVYMPQLSERVNHLKRMMSYLPKSRETITPNVIDYVITNYDPVQAKAMYDEAYHTLMRLQTDLDTVNNTVKSISIDF